MCVLVIFFMIFGNILVYTAFETMMDRETSQNIEDMKIFQYAMLASVDGLPRDYQAMDLAVSEIARSIQQSLYGDQGGIVIYNKEKKVIYQNDEYQSVLIQRDMGGHNGVWQITNQNGHYYLEFICEINSAAGNYILEFHRNIDHVYQDRDRLYGRYQLLLIIVTAVFSVVQLILSLHFTRPARKLSQATRAFANGEYERRVKERGNDEMAVLTRDFNRMAGQLEESIDRLEEEKRRQEEFTSAFSHELKTPLTSIIGYADILRSRKLSDEEQRQCANYIVHQGKRLERLALKMLEMSYIDKQETVFMENEVSQIVLQLEEMTENLLTQKGIKIKYETEKGTIYGEPDLLISLFSNLIDNARKACQEGGTIIFNGERCKEGYRFRITDNGCGIPEEEVYKITEPFYMVDKSRARKEGGAGIGMALCQKIIHMHQAEWKIESKAGEGTSISIVFPPQMAGEPDSRQTPTGGGGDHR